MEPICVYACSSICVGVGGSGIPSGTRIGGSGIPSEIGFTDIGISTAGRGDSMVGIGCEISTAGGGASMVDAGCEISTGGAGGSMVDPGCEISTGGGGGSMVDPGCETSTAGGGDSMVGAGCEISTAGGEGSTTGAGSGTASASTGSGGVRSGISVIIPFAYCSCSVLRSTKQALSLGSGALKTMHLWWAKTRALNK